MAKLFHLDNPVWIFLGKLTDMVILTILWGAFCIPLVTVGASTAALYDVSLKLAENQEGYIFLLLPFFPEKLEARHSSVACGAVIRRIFDIRLLSVFSDRGAGRGGASGVGRDAGHYLFDDTGLCVSIYCII